MSPDDPRAVEALGKAGWRCTGALCDVRDVQAGAEARRHAARRRRPHECARRYLFGVCDLYEPAEEGEVPPELDDDAESA